MAASEVDKAQANIDSILGGGLEFRPSAILQPSDIDASGLFDYAGMDTNRTHVSVSSGDQQSAFNFDSNSGANQAAQNNQS